MELSSGTAVDLPLQPWSFLHFILSCHNDILHHKCIYIVDGNRKHLVFLPESLITRLRKEGLRKEECKLSAINEEEEPLLRTFSPTKRAPPAIEEAGGARQIEQGPRMFIPQRKRTRSLSGLVTSNDFFIPCPLTVTGVFSPTSIDTPVPESPRKEIHPESLRGQYTPRGLTKRGSVVSREGNWAGDFRGKAIKGRDRCAGHRLSSPQNQKLQSFTCSGERATTDLERKLREQGITPVYYPDNCAGMQCGQMLYSSMISDLRVFLTRPAPQSCGPIECHIRRHVHAKWLSPSYRLYLSAGDRFLLSSRKRKKTKSNYIISLDEEDISKHSGNYFGKLRSNFVGTEFWFYDKGIQPGSGPRFPIINYRVEMGAVKYHYNVLGLGGPRKMTAIIPALQEDGNKPYIFPPGPEGAPVILDCYKRGRFRDKMVVLQNKQPHFNKQLAAYCLNFNGRVTKASKKNFQLVADSDKDHVFLQFGKIGRNLFTMDYQHPLSALQEAINLKKERTQGTATRVRLNAF